MLRFVPQSAGSLGAVAGFAIAVVFAWRFLRPSQGRPRRPAPKRPPATPAGTPDSVVSDAPEPVGDSGKVGFAGTMTPSYCWVREARFVIRIVFASW